MLEVVNLIVIWIVFLGVFYILIVLEGCELKIFFSECKILLVGVFLEVMMWYLEGFFWYCDKLGLSVILNKYLCSCDLFFIGKYLMYLFCYMFEDSMFKVGFDEWVCCDLMGYLFDGC